MIFTHICRVVAVLGLPSSIFLLVGGLANVSPKVADMNLAMGFVGILIFIAMGTLAEISISLRRSSKP